MSGKRNMSAPAFSSMDHASSSSDDARAAQLLHELSRRMPAQYALTTSYADRLEHARLLAETALGAKPQADAVRLAWRLEEGSHATLWLVFPDRRGSLGLITSLLSELGVNIGKVSAFSSTDGFAVDTFTVDRCVSELEGDAPCGTSVARPATQTATREMMTCALMRAARARGLSCAGWTKAWPTCSALASPRRFPRHGLRKPSMVRSSCPLPPERRCRAHGSHNHMHGRATACACRVDLHAQHGCLCSRLPGASVPTSDVHSRASAVLADWRTLSLGTAAAPPGQQPPHLAGLPGGQMAAPVGGQPPPPASGAALPTVGGPAGGGPPPELSNWTLDEVETLNGLQGQFSNLRVRKLIDEGASSQVWEGEWAGARVVVKVLREHEALRSFLSEVRRVRPPLGRRCMCATQQHDGCACVEILL